MAKKKNKYGYFALVWYYASGYSSGLEPQLAMHKFHFLADSFGEAAERAVQAFEEYAALNTSVGSGYEGLTYTIRSIDVEKRILSN